MIERTEGFELRPWQRGDEAALSQLANNRRIWRNLTDSFPHPYRLQDAVDWIEFSKPQTENAENTQHLAIVLHGEPVGGVGFERLRDLCTRTAEIGYWIGEPFWGRGIATSALSAATDLAFREFDFVRLQAGVLEWNPASCRVLEKVGYSPEGLQRGKIYKDGEVCGQFMYALLREDRAAQRP
jgi:ribosomal-protein-alanine N-acetyltransferase